MTRAIVSLVFIFLSLTANAQTYLDDRRLSFSPGTDFYGSDYRSLLDTSLEICRATCLEDTACRALTFNARSGSCFLKTDVGVREPYAGAVSAEIVPRDEQEVVRANARAADLSFLDPEDLADARETARTLPLADRPEPADLTAERARGAELAGEVGLAARLTAESLSVADTAESWADLARLVLILSERREGDVDERDAAPLPRALPAAINAYLRSADDAGRARHLELVASALEADGRGETALLALRLAETLTNDAGITARLAQLRARYGFRLVEHDVEADAPSPRICLRFSDPLIAAGTDYARYLGTSSEGLATTVEDDRLCLTGVVHGERYRFNLREGLPAASGETLSRSVEIVAYVRDRSPGLRFPGQGYVLPSSGPVALPVIGVNLPEAALVLRRISDRNLVRTLRDDLFARPVPHYRQDEFERDISEPVWSGTATLGVDLNRDVTTRLALEQETGPLLPGVYALQASIPGAEPYEAAPATQWFVVSDLGLTTLEGADGLHVFARSLGTTGPLEGITLTLISQANAVLATAVTDAAGRARFGPGLIRGEGATSAAMLLAEGRGGDTNLLPLTGPEFDLSDRGVEGRAPAGPIDIWMTTTRGVYRPGETVIATVLVRDDRARAIDGLPITAILRRPDGVEYSRSLSNEDAGGGHVLRLATAGTVPRGTWRLDIHADPDAPPLASERLLIEDFLPERLDLTLALPDAPLPANGTGLLDVEARYLFGAPAAGLPVEGEMRLLPVDSLPDWPGYRFGRHDRPSLPLTRWFEPQMTDDAGHARVSLPLGPLPDGPLEAQITLRVAEGAGRPVERGLMRPVAPGGPMIGIKPLFDGTLPEGSEARLDLVATGADGPVPAEWVLDRIETDYQWYSLGGIWQWEPITTRERIDSGQVTLGTEPVTIATGTTWGRYELRVDRQGGGASSSVGFEAGWYAEAGTDTPDMLDLSLDADTLAPGDTARLRLLPREEGTALVMVISDRLIDMRAVNVGPGENVIDLPVTEDWRPGAYVMASFLRPAGNGVAPARALGLDHLGIEPGDTRIAAGLTAPVEARPREPLNVTLAAQDLSPDSKVWAVIAAVDLGVLNLTGFVPPDPVAYYLGQRRLGMGIRDIYGRLIDGQTGNLGKLRSGGDAEIAQLSSAPPPEAVLALVEGPVQLDETGQVSVSFDMPAFNGTVRVMAMLWAEAGVGAAQADVLVRDPVVASVTLPQFLAPGDQASLGIEVTPTIEGSGPLALEIEGEGVVADTTGLPAEFELAQGQSRRFRVPITAGQQGAAEIAVTLTTADGDRYPQRHELPIRLNEPETRRTSRFDLEPGQTFRFGPDVFSGLGSGARATLAAGPLAQLDVSGLLATLDRYPYGCTEQVTSRALPLLYLGRVASALGLGDDPALRGRVAEAITAVLARQTAEGSFGLWRAEGGDFWLDAYVTDFLSRARAQGHAVPEQAFAQALDNLANRVNYGEDFERGGEDIAYALHVLAREARARIGDLRYFADEKAGDFATPLALAQLGSALAGYGDGERASRMFSLAGVKVAQAAAEPERATWRPDYGTALRDRAAVLTLAAEAGGTKLDTGLLVAGLGAQTIGQPLSTQEATWSLLAANALVSEAAASGLEVDGKPLDGPLIEARADDSSQTTAIHNAGAEPVTLTLTTFGISDTQEPAQGEGLAIERAYYTLDGQSASPGNVAAGSRLVTVLTVRPLARIESRLMVDDPLPAGFEIDNPNLLRAGDLGALDWFDPVTEVQATEFRADRFLAAVDWQSDEEFQLGYIVRAVSPGLYRHPAASVEDMYRPRFRARTGTGQFEVTP